MNISPTDISVVVQGAIDKQNTPHCLESIRNYLPGAEIILSTWKGSGITGLHYDVLVENEDPGAIPYRTTGALNNLNRQIVSSLAGLARVQRKYALKFRSDLFLTSDKFLEFFDKFTKRSDDYKVFNSRVLTSALFSREGMVDVVGDSYHKSPLVPSDWWFFGFSEDVKKIFDISLVEEPEFSRYFECKRNSGDFLWRFSPEQYIGNNLLKHNPEWGKYEMADTHNYPFETIEFSKKLLTNNFVFLGFRESGIFTKKYMPFSQDERLLDRNQYNGLITYYRFLKNYKRYCDGDYEIPTEVKDFYNGTGFELDDISFIIQGQIDPEITPQTTKSIRRFFPGAEIVIGTYVDKDTAGLDYDKIALCEDPGSYPYADQPDARENNVNRQIQTTLCGLRAATRRYAFKLRSDFVLTGSDFLKFWDRFPKFDPKYRIFEHKILSCVFFARNPRLPNSYPFHPSDIAFFGLRTDLLNMFDVPFMTEQESTYYEFDGVRCCRYVPEQHLWVNCLRKNGKKIKFDHQKDTSDKIVEDTGKYAVSNFVYLDWGQFNLIPPKKLTTFANNNFSNVITHIEWQKLYRKYLDNALVVPGDDYLRKYIDRSIFVIRRYGFLVRMVAILFPTKWLRNFRKTVRKRMMECLTKNMCVPTKKHSNKY